MTSLASATLEPLFIKNDLEQYILDGLYDAEWKGEFSFTCAYSKFWLGGNGFTEQKFNIRCNCPVHSGSTIDIVARVIPRPIQLRVQANFANEKRYPVRLFAYGLTLKVVPVRALPK